MSPKLHTEIIYATLDMHEFQDLLVSNRFLLGFLTEIWHLIGQFRTSSQATESSLEQAGPDNFKMDCSVKEAQHFPDHRNGLLAQVSHKIVS